MSAAPIPQGDDFAPCRCGDSREVLILPLDTPHQLRSGSVFIAVCGRCGYGVPFITYRVHGGSVMPDAIAAWNAAAALAASEAQMAYLHECWTADFNKRQAAEQSLRFYANPKNYESLETCDGNGYCPSEIDKDGGKKARAAIDALLPKGEGATS